MISVSIWYYRLFFVVRYIVCYCCLPGCNDSTKIQPNDRNGVTKTFFYVTFPQQQRLTVMICNNINPTLMSSVRTTVAMDRNVLHWWIGLASLLPDATHTLIIKDIDMKRELSPFINIQSLTFWHDVYLFENFRPYYDLSDYIMKRNMHIQLLSW